MLSGFGHLFTLYKTAQTDFKNPSSDSIWPLITVFDWAIGVIARAMREAILIGASAEWQGSEDSLIIGEPKPHLLVIPPPLSNNIFQQTPLLHSSSSSTPSFDHSASAYSPSSTNSSFSCPPLNGPSCSPKAKHYRQPVHEIRWRPSWRENGLEIFHYGRVWMLNNGVGLWNLVRLLIF